MYPVVERLTANRALGRAEYRNIFIHATRGPGDRTLEEEYRIAVNYLTTPGTPASAQFVVGPSEVTRLVRDEDSSWHASENNRTALSIEFAQPSSLPPFTEFQYRAGAEIVYEWCQSYGIPPVRVFSQAHRGVIGHEDSEQGKRFGKTDPGSQFNWSYFMSLVVPTVQGPDRLVIRGELDKLWHIAGLLESISAHDTAAVLRNAAVTIKRETGIQ